jgi:hypothetical protein
MFSIDILARTQALNVETTPPTSPRKGGEGVGEESLSFMNLESRISNLEFT